MITLVLVVYAMTPMPKANASAMAQASTIHYAGQDGKQGAQLARVGQVNRQKVEFEQVPKHVRDAVLAAENRSFYSDPGVSPKGIARAAWGAATGGNAGGGSTITQQLAKNYYLTPERSMKRKVKELFISIKVERKLTKDEILETYLNTVYFGRDSYGIQAASKSYFGKDVKNLDKSEGAYLAGIIQLPEYYGTKGDTDAEKAQIKQRTLARYQYVVDGMVKMGTVNQAEAATLKAELPDIKRPSSDQMLAGQNGYIRDRVLAELKNRYGITQQQLTQQPLRITTTFDKGLQDRSAQIVREYKRQKNLPKGVQFGLAMVNPKNGEVVAAYGGPNYLKHGWDNSYDSQLQPGSSFKPYVLAAALSKQWSLRSTINGDSPQNIGGTTFHNDSPREQGVYNLIKATQMSVNTAYVQLGVETGLKNVVDSAVKAGIPRKSQGLTTNENGISLGTALVRPIDQAAGYATFANQGRAFPAHVVKKIEMIDGKEYKKLPKDSTEAFTPDVASDATYAMQQVLKAPGTGRKAALPGRPAAGKTGTTSQNKAAWFVGYTPQYSTSVAMWREKKTKNGPVQLPLTGIGGYTKVYGGDIPAELWNRFMKVAHEGKDVEQFQPPAYGGTTQRWATPPPPTRSPDPRPTDNCEDGMPCPPTSPPIPTPPTCMPGDPRCDETDPPNCRPPLCPRPSDTYNGGQSTGDPPRHRQYGRREG